MTDLTRPPLRAHVRPCPPPGELAPLWRRVEAGGQGSFFLSWRWIGTQLAVFGPAAHLLEIRHGEEVKGLALLGRRRRAWAPWRSPSLHLNEVDDPASAALAIEYNGFLALAGWESRVAQAGLGAILDLSGWRECELPGIPPDLLAGFPAGLRLTRRQGAPFAALAGGDPLERLSRNTRQQLRRSLRLYDRPMLEAARDEAEALDWFERMVELHGVQWRKRGSAGAFANPRIRTFHRRLLVEGGPAGQVEMLRLADGGGVHGYLYNFRHGGWVHAYQSGFRPDPDPRRKPGLCAHLLAMRRAQAQGMRGYRFLAGDSRYKHSLAVGRDEMVWALADRGDAAHRLERWLRGIRDKARARGRN